MANGWNGSALPPPNGVTFVPGVLALGRNLPPSSNGTRLEAFTVRNEDGTVWHAYQQQDSGSWSSWGQLVGPSNNPAPAPGVNFKTANVVLTMPKTLVATTNQPGFLELFAIGSDGNPYHMWQTPGGKTAWSDWAQMTPPPFPVISLDVAMDGNGQLVVVYFCKGGTIYYDYQTAPASGPWQAQTTGFVQEVPRITPAIPGFASQPNLFGNGSLTSTPLGLFLVAVGQPGGFQFWVNTLPGAAQAWAGWTVGPAYVLPGYTGLPNSQISPCLVFANGEWPAIFDADTYGSVAGAQFNPGVGGAWANFVGFAGPALPGNAFGSFQLPVTATTLPQIITYAPGGIGAGGVDSQWILVFALDSTSQGIVQVAVLCGNSGSFQQTVPVTVKDKASPGVVSAVAVATNGNGMVEVLAVENANQCSHFWQGAVANTP